MNPFGLLLGLAMLACVGAGFAWVIQAERHLGRLWWPYFLALGALIVLASLFIPTDWGSGLVGILGASIIWGSTELKDQAARAELGWFPFKAQKILPPFARHIRKWRPPHL